MSKTAFYLKQLGITAYVPRVALAPAAVLPSYESFSDARPVWQDLEARVLGCTLCGLCQSRKNTVFGVGNRSADLLFVGEAPGATEDERGEPFVGQAGQLLDKMMAAIGQSRETAFIANIVKCRPPNNRDPLPEEAAECMPYLLAQIQLIQPKLIVALGRIAAQNLLNTSASLGKLRGETFSFGLARIPLVVTYHPAYLLRNPAEKRHAWIDLQRIRTMCASTQKTEWL